jgi:cytoskeletal protein CcmA (bactofilin family)
MFSTPKRNDTYNMSDSGHAGGSATVIAHGVKVEGEFVSQGDVMIEGEVHGHIATSGMLTVGTDAKLKADVAAQEAVVAGLVEGNMTIKSRLELKSTAKILGDVACETAVIEAGAVLSGKVMIGNGGKQETHPKNEKFSKVPPPPPAE